MKLERILYLLHSFIERNNQQINKYVGDQLKERRMIKQYCINLMVMLKIYSRTIEQYYNYGLIQRNAYEKLRTECGNLVLLLISRMDNSKIRLNNKIYKAIFNIPYQVWKNCYGDEKPDNIMDIVFVNRLSEEVMFDYMTDVILHQIKDDAKARKRVNNYIKYEIGIPI